MGLQETISVRRSDKVCTLGALLEAESPLDTEDRAVLRVYLTEKDEAGRYTFGGTAISDDLGTMNVLVSESQVRKHRRARCACKDRAVR